MTIGTITVRVQDGQNSRDQKVHFSSIRVPRLPPREVSPDANKGKQQKQKGGNQQPESEEQRLANEEKEKERAQQEVMREKLVAIERKRVLAEMTPEDKKAALKREEEAKKKAEQEKEQSAYAVLGNFFFFTKIFFFLCVANYFLGKDYLRKKLIGKTVRCTFDYSQTEKDDKFSHNNNKNKQPTIKNYYSVYEGKNNVAIDIVRQGFGM